MSSIPPSASSLSQVVLLFGYSCGHDRGQSDGLNFNKVGKHYGGAYPKQRDSRIDRADGFLGPHHDPAKHLHVGDTQSKVFGPNDAGPFWLSQEKRNETRDDKEFEIGPDDVVDKTCPELVGTTSGGTYGVGKQVNTFGVMSTIQHRNEEKQVEYQIRMDGEEQGLPPDPMGKRVHQRKYLEVLHH